MAADPVVSVVVPVYNEEAVLPEFYERMKAALQALNVSTELVFVDDGSKDDSASILKRIQAADASVRVLRFSRNFGHQIALKAGIDHVRGEAVVTIDADLQDPPEAISEMFAEWKNGHDVVYAVRAERKGETFFKKFTAAVYYRLLRSLSSVKLPVDAGEFRLMSREVADVIRGIDEKDPYIRGWVAWAGARQKAIQIRREPRFAGETKYSLTKMALLALNGLRQFSRFNRNLRSLARPAAGTSLPVYELLPEEAAKR